METLLAILLYLGVISTNVEYSESQIYSYEDQYKSEIEMVENDPVQLQEAQELYQKEGDKVIVFVEDVL